jgi:hypothetical protein
MSGKNETSSFIDGAFSGFFFLVTQYSWTNFDSQEEAMVTIPVDEVEGLRFYADGRVVGLFKRGNFSADPEENGVAAIDAERHATYNYAGQWQIADGCLSLRVDQQPGFVGAPNWYCMGNQVEFWEFEGGRIEGAALVGKSTYHWDTDEKLDQTDSVCRYERVTS